MKNVLYSSKQQIVFGQKEKVMARQKDFFFFHFQQKIKTIISI